MINWLDREADVAQLAERVLGKDEVTGSIPVIGSRRERKTAGWGPASSEKKDRETRDVGAGLSGRAGVGPRER